MMKFIYKIFCYTFFITILLSACKNDDQTHLQAGWSSKDPIAIPFNSRNHEKDIGNLVHNPSFETGKIYYEESSIKSYDITGWKKTGENIEWIKANDGDYSADQVYHGEHAIKITRKNADETEKTGDGIISDFIKVIPGNYLLKIHLKLENICPNQERVGIKMYDAVNIRLQYYDKNKIEINGEEFDAFSNKRIDNTFKALSLSNFRHINEFGWGEIYGKTSQYPFFDGDIPDNARYVKIFIGLKGTGTMWVDQVELRYTNENFTLLERLKPYFDSSYFVYDMVCPRPQELKVLDHIRFYEPDSNVFPLIVIPGKNNKTLQKLAEKIKDNITAYISQNGNVDANIRIVKEFDFNEIEKDQMIISLGHSELYNQFKNQLPDSLLNIYPKSYYIHGFNSVKNLVFIVGQDQEAYFNAINTFLQLFETKSKTYYCVKIFDYPDFLERGFAIHSFDKELDILNQKLNLLNDYKFNHVYFEWYNDKKGKYYPFDSYDDVSCNFPGYSILANLYSNFPGLYKIQSSKLQSVLLYSDLKVLKDCEQSKSEITDKQFSFEYLSALKPLQESINKNNKSVKLELLPVWSNLGRINRNEIESYMYFHELFQDLSNITMFWTGSGDCSKSIDYADVKRIKSVYKAMPALFDNNLFMDTQRLKTEYQKNYYAGKIRTLSLFEPYSFEIYNGFMYDTKPKVLLNLPDLSELSTIRSLTAADYYWNTKDYNPDRSLWIVLNKLYGKENAINLLYFNDSYYGLKEICQKIELNGLQYKNQRIAKNFESDLNKYFNELEKRLNNKYLIEEIRTLKDSILLICSELTTNVN